MFCQSGCMAYADTSENTIRGPANDIELLNQIIGAKSFYFGRYFVSDILYLYLEFKFSTERILSSSE